jgi:hypothetical protein
MKKAPRVEELFEQETIISCVIYRLSRTKYSVKFPALVRKVRSFPPVLAKLPIGNRRLGAVLPWCPFATISANIVQCIAGTRTDALFRLIEIFGDLPITHIEAMFR